MEKSRNDSGLELIVGLEKAEKTPFRKKRFIRIMSTALLKAKFEGNVIMSQIPFGKCAVVLSEKMKYSGD